MAGDQFTALYVADRVLRAALMVNDDAQMDLLRELIADSALVGENVERLADTGFDLASLRSSGG